MDASIIVCTYNRCESLDDSLNAIIRQITEPDYEWELIVVDNNSTDSTKTIVEKFSRLTPSVKYIFEANQGLSFARNTGVKAAVGELILFTDDDVLPEEDWLQNVLSGVDKYGADAVGGYIAPIWEEPPPSWLTDKFHGFLAVRMERTDDYQIDSSSQAPFGANMGIKRKLFDEVGFFDTERGRKGNVLASGEDGEMFERLLSAGAKVMFIGNARVHHKVEKFRLKKKYFRNWRYQTSKNLAMTVGMPGEKRILNVPPYLVGQFLRSIYRALIGKIILPEDEAFRKEMICHHFAGLIRGLYLNR